MPETKGKKERATRKIVGRMGYKALFKPGTGHRRWRLL